MTSLLLALLLVAVDAGAPQKPAATPPRKERNRCWVARRRSLYLFHERIRLHKPQMNEHGIGPDGKEGLRAGAEPTSEELVVQEMMHSCAAKADKKNPLLNPKQKKSAKSSPAAEP